MFLLFSYCCLYFFILVFISLDLWVLWFFDWIGIIWTHGITIADGNQLVDNFVLWIILIVGFVAFLGLFVWLSVLRFLSLCLYTRNFFFVILTICSFYVFMFIFADLFASPFIEPTELDLELLSIVFQPSFFFITRVLTKWGIVILLLLFVRLCFFMVITYFDLLWVRPAVFLLAVRHFCRSYMSLIWRIIFLFDLFCFLFVGDVEYIFVFVLYWIFVMELSLFIYFFRYRLANT